MTRGQEGCVYVYSQREFESAARADVASRRPKLGKQGRDYLRMFLSGAAQEIPDKQFRVTIPPMLREYAGLDRDLTVIGAGTRAEIWDTAAWNDLLRHRRGRLLRRRRGGDRRTLLSASCPTLSRAPCLHFPGDRSQRMGIRLEGPAKRDTSCPMPALHIPVLLDRTIELLAPALERPGAVLVDATLGLGGHAEAFLERFPELQLRRSRPRPATRSPSRPSASRRSGTASSSSIPSTTASGRCWKSSAFGE